MKRDWIRFPGVAGVLVDRVRKALTKNKCLTDEWLGVMRAASEIGMRGTATMMFGHIETLEERVEHLRRVRSCRMRRECSRRLSTGPIRSRRSCRCSAILWEARST